MDAKEATQLATEIFREYGPTIRALIRRRVHCEQDADDVYQNIFLSLVRTPPVNLTSLLAYLNKVVRNHTTDLARRTTSYNNCLSRYASVQDNAKSPGPEAELVRTEGRHEMAALLESILPPHMAHVIDQRYSRGSNIQETAMVLGLKQRTVSRYHCVAIKRIRQFVDDHNVDIDAYV